MKDHDVVLSTRIRLARNIKDYPFACMIDKTSAAEIIEKVGNVLGDSYTKIDFNTLPIRDQRCFVEQHRVSSDFVGNTIPRALFEKNDTHIMVCEEDHIRLQVIKKGFDPEACYEEACQSDDIIINDLRIAYDEEIGFLTHCPTNLGTGMRVSVMMFLPGLALTGQISSVISQLGKLGMTIRGIYGEGSEASGYMYQISNTRTLGASEPELIGKLKEIVTQIIDFERSARERVRAQGIRTEDMICRSLGNMRYACIMSSNEFILLYSKVRLGISLGYIDDITLDELDELFVRVMPNSICAGEELSEDVRDRKRALLIKERLKK